MTVPESAPPPDFNFVSESDETPSKGPKEHVYFDEEGRLVEVDASGVPRIPGTDDRLERHPFDPDDQDDEIPPATAMNMCCLVGPCRNYREVVLEEPTEGDEQWAVLRRICRHYQDHEADWDLSEETMYACSAYAPPWWSLRGRLRRIINWTELALARKKLSPDWWQWYLPESLTALCISKVLGAVRLFPDRKNLDIAKAEPGEYMEEDE